MVVISLAALCRALNGLSWQEKENLLSACSGWQEALNPIPAVFRRFSLVGSSTYTLIRMNNCSNAFGKKHNCDIMKD